MPNKKSKAWHKGHSDALAGKPPYNKYKIERYTIQYTLGYAQGYEELQAKQVEEAGLFVFGFLEDILTDAKAIRNAEEAETLVASIVANCAASINERQDWIIERELQKNALKTLIGDLKTNVFKSKNHVYACVSKHVEAQAILGGRNTNCKNLRD